MTRRDRSKLILAGVLAAAAVHGVVLVSCLTDRAGKATASATDQIAEPSTESLIDEDYRFRLAWPGDGCKLVGERDVVQLLPDAIAGIHCSQPVSGAVLVEYSPRTELDYLVPLVVSTIALEDRVVEKEERLVFQGKPARRVTLTGRVRDAPLRYVVIVFVHQDHAYKLVGWGPQSVLPADGKAVQPFFDAFMLLDGEVTGRDEMFAPGDASGPGWELRQGVFRSAPARLRIVSPKGWRVAVGRDLQSMNGDAEVGLIARNPERYITVIAEPAPRMDEEDFLRMTRDELSADLDSSTATSTEVLMVAGEKRPFIRLRSTNPPREFLHTAFYRSGLAYQIEAWYAGIDNSAAVSRVAAGLAAIELLDDQEADQLRGALEAEPDRQHEVGEGFSLRRGLYRNFADKWTWRKPAGFWRIQVGQSARERNPDASLFAHEPAKDLSVMVISEPTEMDTASYTAAVRDDMALRLDSTPTEPNERALGEVHALIFDIDRAMRSGPVRHRVVTAVHQGTGLQILVWGAATRMQTQAKDVDAVIDGFRFVPDLQAVNQHARTYRDWRMGYSFDPGSNGWHRQDETVASIASIAAHVSWRKGSSAMQVLALSIPDPQRDRAWSFDFLEQRVREALGTRTRGEPTRADVIVAGEPGRRLTWKRLFSRVDVYLARRDQTVYAILGVGLDSDAAAALPTRFDFLD